MFGDMFGNMQEQQESLKKKLAEINVNAEAGDGAIKVTANANRDITNISINGSQLDVSDTEQLEDLLMVAVNRALQKAAEREAEETQKMIEGILPPGMGDMGKLFGG